jgi:PAS domain S-box-containing protein
VQSEELYRLLQEQASEELFRATWEAAVDAMALVDPEGMVLFANSACLELFGCTVNEVVGHSFIVVLPGDRRDIALEEYKARFNGNDPQPPPFEATITRKDGSTHTLEWRASFIKQGHKRAATMFLIRDITDCKKAEDGRSAIEAAQQANAAKSEFLSRISHELRTPLNSILGFAQILGMDNLTPSQMESLSYINRAGNHLLELINEVLDITRIETGKLPVYVAPIDLRDVLEECTQLMEPMAARAGIIMTVDLQGVGPCECYVMADAQRLKQVLLNLMSNSIKYNRERGAVLLSCMRIVDQGPDARDRAPGKNGGSESGSLSATTGKVRILVSDTGYGIAAADLDKLFTPFERLGAASRGVEGTGLGLALCKRLVEAMGCSIGVQSEVGVGSTFWVDVDLADRSVLSQHAAEMSGRPLITTLLDHDCLVLYIEDDPSNLKLVERVIEHNEGWKLLTAPQGGIGLELAKVYHPDVVLLNLHLPDMTGEEMLRRLREDPETRAIPVVVLSADARPRHVDKLLESGVAAYLTKPVDLKALLETLDDVLRRQS